MTRGRIIVVSGGNWIFKCYFILPPTPSVWDQVAVELASIHAVGDGGIFAVAIGRVFACCTGVFGANVEPMSPAIVHVVVVSGGAVSSWWSSALSPGWWASLCNGGCCGGCIGLCLSICLECGCKLSNIMSEGGDLGLVGSGEFRCAIGDICCFCWGWNSGCSKHSGTFGVFLSWQCS